MASWGNSGNTQHDQDMESPSGRHLYATNNDANDVALKGSNNLGNAIHSDGDFKVDGDSDFNGDVGIKTKIQFNDPAANAYIDSYDGQTLNLNTQEDSGNIYIGKESDANTTIKGHLTVRDEINPTGDPGSTLKLATSTVAYNVSIGYDYANRYTDVNNKLRCLYGINHPMENLPVPIGGYSNGVDLAASGDVTHVKGTLDVDESATFNAAVTCEDNVTVEGTLQVTGDSVDLDAPVDLDCNTTGAALNANNSSTATHATAVKATGPIAINAQGRSSFSDHIALASDKRIALDGASAQNYITYNSTDERMEFYIGGTLRFIIDENGGHNP